MTPDHISSANYNYFTGWCIRLEYIQAGNPQQNAMLSVLTGLHDTSDSHIFFA
jgi:hypothetical protein